jgi:hypothetical protein
MPRKLKVLVTFITLAAFYLGLASAPASATYINGFMSSGDGDRNETGYIGANDYIYLDVDIDDGGTGALIVRDFDDGSATRETMYMDAQNTYLESDATRITGTAYITGTTNTNGISNDGDGISSVGALSGVSSISMSSSISGATTISASSTITGGSLVSNGTLGVSGATTLSSTLGVSGATTLSSTLGVTGLTTLNGINNGGDGITNAGAISGVTTLDASGLASLDGGINVNDNFTVGTNGNTGVGGTLGVTGATTLSGGETVYNGAAIYSAATATGNSMVVDSSSSRFVSASGTNNVAVNNSGVQLAYGTSHVLTVGSTTTQVNGTASLYSGAGTGNQITVDSSSARLVSASASNGVLVNDSSVQLAAGGANTLTVTSTTTQVNGTAALYSGSGSGNRILVDSSSARLMSASTNQSLLVNNSGTTVYGTAAIYSGSGTGNEIFVDSGSSRLVNSTNSNGLVTNSTATTITGYTASGLIADNTVIVGDTQTAIVGVNSLDYGTEVNGGMLINGDLGVNGNIYTLNPTANATINVANNGMSITGATNEVTLTSDNDDSADNARAQLALDPESASLYVNTDEGVSHGLFVGQSQTVISGGTNSTSMTLDDWGATFRNDDTGGPARVTGIADGQSDFDAVNYRQLNSGVASVAALAGIPAPIPGKNVAIGVGYGNYHGTSAVAMGIKANMPKSNVSLTLGVGYCQNDYTASGGVSISF